jgi:hypothetical protein
MNNSGGFQGLNKVPMDGLALGHVHHLWETLLCDEGVELLLVLDGEGSVRSDINLLRLINPLPASREK